MRTVSFLLALALIDCGPGPKSARSEDKPAPPKWDSKAAEERLADAVRDPAAKKESYTAAVARFEATVAGLAETQGNTNAELEGIKNELRGLKGEVAEIRSLLSVDAEISIEVPKAADVCVPESPPVKSDAAPIENTRTVGPTLNGKPLNVAATIKANYRRMWSFPGSIDSHLAEHGVAGTAGLDYETKRKLHSAIHEMGIPAKAVVKERTVVKAPMALPQSSCPNGQCPNVQQYGYYSNRRGLFGRWR